MGQADDQVRPEIPALAGVAPGLSALVAVAEVALAASPTHVLFVEHDGTGCVGKRAAHRRRSLWQSLCLRWRVYRVSGHALPIHSLRLSQASSHDDCEAKRLAAIGAAGIRVPRVIHRCDGFLILAHCGSSIATLLQRWTQDVRRQQRPRLEEQLGDFHEAGQWHGAAQIKKLTRLDGLDYRIDFEEDFDERVPLAAAQALDPVWFLNSISLRVRVDEAEARRLLSGLIDDVGSTRATTHAAAVLGSPTQRPGTAGHPGRGVDGQSCAKVCRTGTV